MTGRRHLDLATLAIAVALGASTTAGCGGELVDDQTVPGEAANVTLEGDVAILGDDVAGPRSAMTSSGSAPPVLFLNFEGVTLYPGGEDAIHNRSSIVKTTTVIPKFDHKHFKLQEPWLSRQTAIDRIVGKVRSYFSGYNLTIVTKRPSSGPYTMLVVGGKRLPNVQSNALGVSPMDCGNRRPSEVGFAFSDSMSGWSTFPKTTVAVTIAHEAGHSFGLDHISPQTAVMNAASWDLVSLLKGWKSGTATSTYCAKSGTQDSAKVLKANLRSLASGNNPTPTSCHTGKLFSSSYCSAACLCKEGQGHCDSDDECASGLKCVAGAGSRHGTSSSVAVCEKPKSSSDTQRPSVAIVQPTDKSSVPLKFAVHARVTDDGVISKVEVSLDGKTLGTKTSSPYSFAVNATAGIHVVTVSAVDASGKRASDTVRVRAAEKSTSAPPDGSQSPYPPQYPTDDPGTLGSPGCSLAATPADASPLLALLLVGLLGASRRRLRR